MTVSISNQVMKYTSLLLLIFVLLFGLHNIRYKSSYNTVFHTTEHELPIYSVQTDKPFLALTFDCAWGTEDLDSILQTLQQHNTKATFFVTGEFVKKHPEAIIKIDEQGHEIANHGSRHIHMPLLSHEEMKKEIQDCHNQVKSIIHKDMTLFRAPYSDWNSAVVDVVHSLSYHAINHSVDSLDWKDYGASSIIHTVCQHKALENGSILLLHTGTKYTSEALDTLLTSLEEKGYSLIPASELILKDNYRLDYTGKQFPM